MSQEHDPYKHRRRSIRLKGWDYSTPAAYFVTICTHQREHFFDDQRFQDIAAKAWIRIPKLPCAEHVNLDEWIVMPNHLHGIVVLVKRKGAGSSQPSGFGRPKSGSLSTIIGTYKSMVTRRVNKLRHAPGGKLWQRGYYERIVRNDRELNAIRRYIRSNPMRWSEDIESLDSILPRL